MQQENNFFHINYSAKPVSKIVINPFVNFGSFPKRIAISTLLVLVWWILIAIQSIRNLGFVGTFGFIFIPIIAVWIYPKNALAFLIATFYLPIAAIQLPKCYVVLFIIVFTTRCLRIPPRLKYINNYYAGLIWGWVLICTTMSLFAYNQGTTLKLLLVNFQSAIFCIVMLLFINSKEDIILAMKWLIFFAGIAFFICAFHWAFFDNTWMTYKISTINPKWSPLGKNTLSSIDHTRRFLWAGSEPNFYAFSLIFPFFSAIGFALMDRNKLLNKWWIIVLLCALGIFGSYSRSAILVTSVFLLFLFIQLRKKALLVITVLSMIFFLTAVTIPSIQNRILTIGNNLIERGGTGRIERAFAGLSIYTNSPLGAGLGTAEKLYRKYGFYFKDSPGPHNTYIQILLETGPQGLLLLLAILWSGMRSIFMLRMAAQNNWNIFYKTIFIGSIASAFFAATIPMSDLKFLFLPSIFGYCMYRSFRHSSRMLNSDPYHRVNLTTI